MTGAAATAATPVILSAYNAAPPDLAEHPDAEADWYRALRDRFDIGGIELPSTGAALHPRGVQHLAGLIDPAWRNIVGGMTCTLAGLASDPDYGIASDSPRGRAAARADVDGLRRDILELRQTLGDDAVQAVVLHSAPGGNRGSAPMLERSLREIVDRDWGRTVFLLEHVDARVAGHEPQKGWQPLESELRVARDVRKSTGADVRLLANWGRAAIETRSAAGAGALIARAVDSGLLGALTFSGASGAARSRGGRWADVHLGLSTDEPDSLLTPDIVSSTVEMLPDDLVFIGIKTGPPVDPGPGPIDRLRFARSILDLLRPNPESV